jgi:hypothetical protein
VTFSSTTPQSSGDRSGHWHRGYGASRMIVIPPFAGRDSLVSELRQRAVQIRRLNDQAVRSESLPWDRFGTLAG